MKYKNDDFSAGQRYNLVQAALAGGCPEMIKMIDDILKYVVTGDKSSLLMGDEKVYHDAVLQSEKLKKDIEALNEDNKNMAQVADKAMSLRSFFLKEYNGYLTEIKGYLSDCRKKIEDTMEYEEVPDAAHAKKVREAIEDCSSVWIITDGYVHKVDAVIKLGKKGLLIPAEKGCKIDRVKNDLSNKLADKTQKVRDELVRMRKVATNLEFDKLYW